MKAIIEYNLPDDQYEYDMSLSAIKMHTAMMEMGNYLRSEYKYNEYSEEKAEYINEINVKFWQIVSENDINSL